MSQESPVPIPDPLEELDDPYVHTVSTEEFVETVERVSQKETDEVLTSSQD